MVKVALQVFSKNCCSFLSLILLGAGFAATAEPMTERIEFNGFYSLDATFSNNDQSITGKRPGTTIANGDEINLKNSILGAKVSYLTTDTLTVTIQGQTYVDADDDVNVDINWAYVSYDLSNDNYLRAGLFQMPFLQGTELRSVGYSRLWARPIVLDNGAGGFNEFSGVEYQQRFNMDYGSWQFQFGAGVAEHDLDDVDGKAMAIVTARFQAESYWIHSAIAHIEYDMTPMAMPEMTISGDVSMVSLESQVVVDNTQLNFGLSIGDSHGTPSDTMAYLSLAYPLGEFTPYFYYAWHNQEFNDRLGLNDRTPPPPGMGPLPPPPKNGMPPTGNPQMRPPVPDGAFDRDNYALGLRWDIKEGLAVKAHYEIIEQDNKTGVAAPTSAKRSNTVSLSLEGIF